MFESNIIIFTTHYSAPTIANVDRNSGPDHSTSVGTVKSSNLKTVVVPAQLVSKFLDLAAQNTNNMTETFGALYGKVVPVSINV